MTVPPLSMAIFTGILKEEGYQVELFDTTPYISDDGDLSQKNRRLYLQYREYSDEDDLGIVVKTNLMQDFRKAVLNYKPNLLIWSVVEVISSISSYLNCVQEAKFLPAYWLELEP